MKFAFKSEKFFRIMLVSASLILFLAPANALKSNSFSSSSSFNSKYIPLKGIPSDSRLLLSQSQSNKGKSNTPTGLVPTPPPETLVPPPPPGVDAVYPAGKHPPVSINNAPALNPNDITGSLALKPGMVINFQIQSGVDTRWKHVGDYNFQAKIEFNDQRGYAFHWHMSPPANATGERRVDMEDLKNAHKVSLFYPDNESATLVGFTSIVRISNYLYNKLKQGKKVAFELDGPHSRVVMKRHTHPVPHYIYPVGQDNLNISIDGTNRIVRAIKAETDVGWQYWILDNPNFPLMLAGSGPFKWHSNILSYGGANNTNPNLTGNNNGKNKNNNLAGGSNDPRAKKEADKVIKELASTGKATSYLILFDFDSDRLRPLSKEILIELSQYLVKKQDLKLRVEGHTCTLGGKDYNLNLSQRRAESVKRFLSETCGIAKSRLLPIGYGYSKPVASNKTEESRKKNRRVVFTELKH